MWQFLGTQFMLLVAAIGAIALWVRLAATTGPTVAALLCIGGWLFIAWGSAPRDPPCD